MAETDLNQLKIAKTPLTPRAGRRRRPLLWLLLLLAAAAGGLWAAGLFTPAVEVELATVSQVYPAQALTLLNASGYVVAQRKAGVAAKTTGRLVWLGVEEGSPVRTGEVIARLEDRDVAAARDQAVAQLAVVRAQVGSAEAEAQDAGLAFQRMEELLAQGFIARSEFDQAQARRRSAVAAVSAAKAQVRAAEAALQVAEVTLDYTRIRAPFDGVVLTKNADIGDIVTPIGAAADAKAAVVNIADLASLQVEADVSESNLAKVRSGQPCEIELDSLPDQRFAGTVHMIVPTADRTKATVLVKVRFEQADPRILPEMSARVAFLEHALTPEQRRPRIAVSRSAVVRREGRELIFRVVGGKATAVPVTLGLELGEMVEITSGVQVGERIVARPPAGLRDGAAVKTAAP